VFLLPLKRVDRVETFKGLRCVLFTKTAGSQTTERGGGARLVRGATSERDAMTAQGVGEGSGRGRGRGSVRAVKERTVESTL
jgi:hypothetical protein